MKLTIPVMMPARGITTIQMIVSQNSELDFGVQQQLLLLESFCAESSENLISLPIILAS